MQSDFSQLLLKLQNTPKRILLDNQKDIEAWLHFCGIEEYVIMKDLSVAVENSVHITKAMPFFPVNFKNIWGAFECPGVGLQSLEGAPTSVDSDFDVSHNCLTSLKGSPKKVGGCFKVSKNQLTSLAHGPEIASMYFADKNPLTTLEDLNTFLLADMLEDMSNFYITVDEKTHRPLSPILSFDKRKTIMLGSNDIMYGLMDEDFEKIKAYQAAQKDRKMLNHHIAVFETFDNDTKASKDFKI